MRTALVIPVYRLESDDYSVPRGTYGFITERLGSGGLAIKWLPPHGSTSSVPVSFDDLEQEGEFAIPMSLIDEVLGSDRPTE